jgi:hypothetical protein
VSSPDFSASWPTPWASCVVGPLLLDLALQGIRRLAQVLLFLLTQHHRHRQHLVLPLGIRQLLLPLAQRGPLPVGLLLLLRQLPLQLGKLIPRHVRLLRRGADFLGKFAHGTLRLPQPRRHRSPLRRELFPLRLHLGETLLPGGEGRIGG